MRHVLKKGMVAAIGLVAAEVLAALPSAPGTYANCEVLSYTFAQPSGGKTPRLGAAPSSGTASTETWVVRSSANTNQTYAVRRTRLASGGISMCAYTPNRVLATLAAGKSYATFVQEMAAQGLTVVRELMQDLDGNSVYIIEAAETENDIVEQMTMSIESTGSCSLVRLDHIYEANAVPNDTNYPEQWGLDKIGAPQAWETRTDASSVLVAVLDTGVNYNHYDLNRSMWINDGEILGDGIDNDGNGYVDDIYGMASIGGNPSGNPMDDNGHGSHCAGIIGAAGNNRQWISGVAWKAKIMGLKFLNSEGRGSVSDAITCLCYAETMGVKVVNCSFGSTDWDDYLYVQMKKMSQQGTIFVCAAGNASPGTSPRDNDEYPFYPCNYSVDTLVSVAATDQNDALANFSYYGAQNVDIAAPGVNIYSTVLGTYGLAYKDGTSMATPHVTGALALLWAHYPGETAAGIIDRLYAAAEPIPALAGKVRTGARLSMAGFFGISAPVEISVTQGTLADAVAVYWTAVNNGTHYRVWRAASEGGEKTMLCDWQQGLTFSDETAEPGVTYWYYIQAASSADGASASTYSMGVSGFRPEIDMSRITVYFDPAGGTVSPASKVYRIGETYSELPTPAYSGKAFLGWFTAASGGTRLGEPSLVRADATTLYAQWTASDALRVENLFARQRYPWNGYVDVTFNLYGVPNDETASVTLMAQEETGGSPIALRTFVGPAPTNLLNGAQHVVWNATPDTQGILYTNMILVATVAIDEKPLLPPQNVTASNGTGPNAVTVTWSASENATSYEVWRATANNSASASLIASPTATSYNDTSAVPTTTYWYRVKAVNSKKTSEFSASASGSRKKIPTAIAIAGSTSVTAGGTATYTCTATYNDNTTASVTPTWTIANGSSYASINSSTGVLTANGTATQRSVTIQASYSYNGSTQTMTKNVTINTKSVTISFNANGGSVSPTSQSYTAYGTYGSLSSATRTGYTFAGWFTASSGGTQVTTSSAVPASNTTLWAHWTANTYTVTLDRQSGSGGSSSATATYGSAMPSITVPTRTGYTFGGYYTSTGGSGTQYYTASGTSARTWDKTSPTTLYAKWTPNTYTIRFNANGGTGAMSDLTMTYATSKNLTSNSFTRAGYSFAGWATSSGGNVAYADGASVNNLVTTHGAVVNLYAVWEESLATALDNMELTFTTGGDAPWRCVADSTAVGGYHARSGFIADGQNSWLQVEVTGKGKLTFDYGLRSVDGQAVLQLINDGISGTILSGTGMTGTGANVTYTNNASHTFRWSYSKTNASGNGENYSYVDNVRWSPICTITFNANGGSGSMVAMDVFSGVTTNLTANAFTRIGYTFAGWATSAAGAVAYANCASITPSADMTLYAKWVSVSSLTTALDNPLLTFTTGGNADWEVSTAESYLGGSSARSGTISDSQTTWMQTEVSGEGTLSFWYKVSSESGWDKLIFYIDGIQMEAKSGTDGWAQLEYTLTNNTQHVFKWVYSKDGSVSSGSDCCWIDKVEWLPSDPLASSRYDLRTLGRVTSVKSSGSYGGPCWAFAVLGSLESTLLGETGTTYDFSENNMANLAGFDWGFDDGGNATMAQAYLLRWDGPALESQDSYPSIGTSVKSSPVVHVQNIIYIPPKSSALDNDRIKRAIVEDGGVYVSFWWESAYYNSSTHAYYHPSSSPTSYASLIVGWDDNYSKSNFSTQPAGDGAYIVKTCWGTSFGEAGYVYVSYYDMTMAYSTMYVFKGEPTSNYVRNYQYDPLGMVSSIGYNKSVAHGANMFTAVESESIAAAGVYVLGANATCTIKVYAGCTTGDPVSGTLKSTKTVSFADAGFYTVPLDDEVPVAAGQLFSIVVGMSVPGYNYPIAYEYAYSGYSSAATAESGQSFISADGATWTDLTSVYATANFCCKAYAKGLAGVTVTLDRQGGSGGTASVTATYGKAMPSITVPTRSGYAFGGYYTSTGGSGTQYYTASGASARTWDKTSATTLYAKWTSNVPSAPTGVSLKLSGAVPAVIGGGTITSSGFFLSWNAVAGATEYEVWYNTTSSTSTASQLTQGTFSSSTSYRWTSGYWNNQTYYFWVKAKNASGTSGFSSRVSGTL